MGCQQRPPEDQKREDGSHVPWMLLDEGEQVQAYTVCPELKLGPGLSQRGLLCSQPHWGLLVLEKTVLLSSMSLAGSTLQNSCPGGPCFHLQE